MELHGATYTQMEKHPSQILWINQLIESNDILGFHIFPNLVKILIKSIVHSKAGLQCLNCYPLYFILICVGVF
jgi:hypothetical protein